MADALDAYIDGVMARFKPVHIKTDYITPKTECSWWHDGVVDMVAVWNRALTDDEIESLKTLVLVGR